MHKSLLLHSQKLRSSLFLTGVVGRARVIDVSLTMLVTEVLKVDRTRISDGIGGQSLGTFEREPKRKVVAHAALDNNILISAVEMIDASRPKLIHLINDVQLKVLVISVSDLLDRLNEIAFSRTLKLLLILTQT